MGSTHWTMLQFWFIFNNQLLSTHSKLNNKEKIMDASSFKDSLSKSIDSLKINFKPGTKVTGTIIVIDKRSVFVDINAKSEGIINREELVDKEGNISVKVGDSIEAYFVSDKGGEITLTVKMTGKFINSHLDDAYQSKIPVEGKSYRRKKRRV